MSYDPLSDTSQVISSVVFGPNISRRLGYVLGINVLPPGRAICTYKCLYCPLSPMVEWPGQVGGWPRASSIINALARALSEIGPLQRLDALVLIGNGEPTLHPELSSVLLGVRKARDLLAPEAKIAIFTNSSLLHERGVSEALSMADLVVAKLDAVDMDLWRAINRPYEGLPDLSYVLKGLLDLSDILSSSGSDLVISITFLEVVGRGLSNASEGHLEALASFLSELGPSQVHLETPLASPSPDIRPLTREEVAEVALRLSEDLGEDRVFVLVGTTAPIPVRLLKASRCLRQGAGSGRAELPEAALDLLTHGPGARTRIRILEVLSKGKMNCNQVAKAVGVSWWSAQRQLERLLEAGLVRTVAFGRRTLYAITPTGLSALMALRAGARGLGLPTRLL